MRPRPCISTTCAVSTRITSARPCSRPLGGRCAWRWKSTSARAAPSRPRREFCSIMASIAVVDAGAGNLRSVVRALQFAAPEADIRVCDTAAQIQNAERVVLPGQGAMGDCMAQLDRAGLTAAVLAAARSKPLLGVCVGMQMLFTTSEEAPDTGGLNILAGDVPRFSGPAFQDESAATSGNLLKVPHMGWNRVWQTRSHALW